MTTAPAVAIVFARGGSKGIKRKNLRLLNGKALITHSIESARRSKLIDRVFVSTDDERIAEVARAAGAEVPFMRPPELAQDDTPEWSAWQHAIRTLRAAGLLSPTQAFTSIPPTSPLRATEDIERCLTTLIETDADIVVTVRTAERSPYFNMVTLYASGYAHLVVPPKTPVYRRQSASPVYDITTVAYAAWPDFVLRSRSMFEGRVRTVVVPSERAVDVDTELDLKIAECLSRGSELL